MKFVHTKGENFNFTQLDFNTLIIFYILAYSFYIPKFYLTYSAGLKPIKSFNAEGYWLPLQDATFIEPSLM